MSVAAWLLLAALFGSGVWLWTPDKNRAELEAQYAGRTSTFVDVLGVRLHLRDSAGPGAQAAAAAASAATAAPQPTLLLLHGFGSSLHTWETWALALAATHRVIRIDLPGAGLTGADPTGDYSDERGIALLTALLDERGVTRATFIGHSMGGRLAWRYAVAQPQRDAMIPVANAQDYLRALPRARLVVLPGVGHVPHEEAPAAALPAMQAFLRE